MITRHDILVACAWIAPLAVVWIVLVAADVATTGDATTGPAGITDRLLDGLDGLSAQGFLR